MCSLNVIWNFRQGKEIEDEESEKESQEKSQEEKGIRGQLSWSSQKEKEIRDGNASQIENCGRIAMAVRQD